MNDASQTISEFCTSEKISRAKYFALRREGRGPREMRDGKWVRITAEARRDWQRERETETTAPNEAA
jgi:hypothetical protein